MRWQYDRDYGTHELSREDGWEIGRVTRKSGYYDWEVYASCTQGRCSNLRAAKRALKEALIRECKKDLEELSKI